MHSFFKVRIHIYFNKWFYIDNVYINQNWIYKLKIAIN